MKKPLKRHVDSDVQVAEHSENPVELRDAIKDVFDNNSVKETDVASDDTKDAEKDYKSVETDSAFAAIVASIIKSQLGDEAKNINVADITEVYDPDKKPIQKRQRRTRKKTEATSESKTTAHKTKTTASKSKKTDDTKKVSETKPKKATRKPRKKAE